MSLRPRAVIDRVLSGDRLRWVGRWAVGRAADRVRRAGALRRGDRSRADGASRHVFFTICDHFEPLHGGAPFDQAMARVRAWRERYPMLAAEFADDDGRPPRHTFFFPGEQYDPRLVEPVAELCEQGLGEVEVHLHHDRDTREGLRDSLQRTLSALSSHGLVPHALGRPRWAFIHGNWALANARRDGRWCGVDDELEVLFELGCYADFTFPSSPDECQPRLVNALWYPRGNLQRRRAYERGRPLRVGAPRRERPLLVTGPIALALGERGRPRIEAAALTAADPGTARRLRTWLDCHVHVHGRPEWTFIKLHTHGAPEREAASLLGEPQRKLHAALAALRARGYKIHYMTAREMFNLAMAAVDGLHGPPDEYRDYDVSAPPRAREKGRPGGVGVPARPPSEPLEPQGSREPRIEPPTSLPDRSARLA